MGARCYLDYNATMPVLAEAAEAMRATLKAGLGNPASPHAEGRRSRRLIEQARGEVASLLGAATTEVVFTSGGTEGNAAGLWGLVAGAGGLAGRRLLLSAVEHPAVRAMAEELARLGVVVETLPVSSQGAIDLDALREAVRRGPGVIALQLANSETGVLQPLPEVVEIAHAAGSRVHCDAVQAAGKVPIAAERWDIDTLAITGHKLGAPGGVGVLVARTTDLAPLIPGTQERHRRGGTENLPGIVALGVAARLAAATMDRWERVGQVRDRLEIEVLARLSGWMVYGARAPRLTNTSCLGLPADTKGGAMVAALDLEEFAVSSGPACTSGVERSSPTVEAMGFGRGAAERTLRVSLGPGTREDEVLGFVAACERVMRRHPGGGL